MVQETVVNLSKINEESKLEHIKTKKSNSKNYLLNHESFNQHRSYPSNEYEQMFNYKSISRP